MKNADTPANPTVVTVDENGFIISSHEVDSSGLTKREAFAMAALPATISKINITSDGYTEIIAELSVQMADALLKELEG